MFPLTRPRSRTLLFTLGALLLAGLALPSLAVAKEESKIKTELVAVNDSGASGQVRFKTTGDHASLTLRMRGLAEDTDYTLLSNDLSRRDFTSDGKGRASLHFVAPEKSGSDVLDFDPRRGELVVRDAEGDVLVGALDGSQGRVNLKEQTVLEPTDLGDGGEARARYDERPNGKQRARLQIKHAPQGDFQILVNGEQVTEVTTNGSGSATATFNFFPGKPGKQHGKSKPNNRKQLLDFDALDAFVEIVRGEDLYYSGPLRAQIPGLNVCEPSSTPVALTRSDAIMEGEATATTSVRADCERGFTVAAEGIAEGVYGLYVGATSIGDLEVASDGMGGTAGSTTYSTAPEAGELPLDFDPTAGTLEIRDGDVVLFSGDL